MTKPDVMRRLTWTRLDGGDLLCREYPIRLVKPMSRREGNPGWMVRVPLQRDTAFDDGWQWHTVHEPREPWPLEAANEREARTMVAFHLDYVLSQVARDYEMTGEARQAVVEAAERSLVRSREFAQQARQPSHEERLRDAAWRVCDAWDDYVGTEDREGHDDPVAVGNAVAALKVTLAKMP